MAYKEKDEIHEYIRNLHYYGDYPKQISLMLWVLHGHLI